MDFSTILNTNNFRAVFVHHLYLNRRHITNVDSNTGGIDSNTRGIDSNTAGINQNTRYMNLNRNNVSQYRRHVDENILHVERKIITVTIKKFNKEVYLSYKLCCNLKKKSYLTSVRLIDCLYIMLFSVKCIYKRFVSYNLLLGCLFNT